MQKQPFANVLQNRCSYKFPDIHKKISVLESLFNKVAGFRPATLLKKETPAQVFSYEYHKMFENIFFDGTPPVAASEIVENFLKDLCRRIYKTIYEI